MIVLPVEYPDDIQHELDTKVLPAFNLVIFYNCRDVLSVACRILHGYS